MLQILSFWTTAFSLGLFNALMLIVEFVKYTHHGMWWFSKMSSYWKSGFDYPLGKIKLFIIYDVSV